MKKSFRFVIVTLTLMLVMLMTAMPAFAAETAAAETAAAAAAEENNILGDKAFAAALTVGIAAAFGAIGMALAISKSVESISRQPVAEGKIRTTLMLGLVFVETAIIYALVVAILIIFVL